MHSWQRFSPILGLPFHPIEVACAVHNVWIFARSHLSIVGLISYSIGVLLSKPLLHSYLLNKKYP